jgi:hypothetical protein
MVKNEYRLSQAHKRKQILMSERKMIFTKDMSVGLPWEEGLLEWLHKNYPYSGYHVVTLI